MNPKHKKSIRRKVWRQLYFKEKSEPTIYKDGKVYISKIYQFIYGGAYGGYK